MKAAVGKIVHVLVDPRSNGGEEVASAVITKVGEDDVVNVKVFLDAPENEWRTGVSLFDNRSDLDKDVEKGEDEDDETEPRTNRSAFWPPRS